MKQRRTAAVVLVVALALFGAACGKGTSKEKGKKDDPDTTLSNADFSARIAKFDSALTAAGVDGCAVAEALEADLPDAENTAQMKEYVAVYVQLLHAVAGVLGDGSQGGQALLKAADRFQQEAEKQKYSEDLLDSDAVADILSADEMSDAMAEFGRISSKCAAAEGDGVKGTVPGAPAGGDKDHSDSDQVPDVPPVFGQHVG